MKLRLVRHGETTGNAEGRLQGHADFPLSDNGNQQALALANRMRCEQYVPTHTYSSPLRRTADTARIATAYLDTQIIYWDDLMEYDVGIVSGLTLEEIAIQHPQIDIELELSRQFSGVKESESLAARRRRATRVVDAIIGQHEQKDSVLVVSHGGFIQQVIAVLLGTTRTWGFSVWNTAVFDFSIDMLEWTGSEKTKISTEFFRIERFNDASHLD